MLVIYSFQWACVGNMTCELCLQFLSSRLTPPSPPHILRDIASFQYHIGYVLTAKMIKSPFKEKPPSHL